MKTIFEMVDYYNMVRSARDKGWFRDIVRRIASINVEYIYFPFGMLNRPRIDVRWQNYATVLFCLDVLNNTYTEAQKYATTQHIPKTFRSVQGNVFNRVSGVPRVLKLIGRWLFR